MGEYTPMHHSYETTITQDPLHRKGDLLDRAVFMLA